jgi:hypothetical protein
MMMKRPLLFLSTCLIASLAGYLWLRTDTAGPAFPAQYEPASSMPSPGKSADPHSGSSAGSPRSLADSRLKGEAFSPEASALLDAAFAQPLPIEHGGGLQDFVLANDELHLRGDDGSSRMAPIPPAANAKELLQRIAEVQNETGLSPELVLYPKDMPRTAASRRIVSRDVMLEADSRTEADALASQAGLSFKTSPAYAPGKFIYEARTSPEALAFFVKTADSTSPYVTPLLASRASPMNMPNDQLVGRQWHLKFQNQFGAAEGTDVNVASVWNYPTSPKKKPFNFFKNFPK